MQTRINTSFIRVAGLTLKVSRKRIRNLYLRVTNGQLLVSAPFFLSDESVARFVRGKLDWIKEKLEASRAVAEIFEDGKELAVWGGQFPIAIHPFAGFNSVRAEAALIHVYCREHNDPAVIAALIAAWRKEILLSPGRQALEMWRRKLGIPYPLELAIRKMRARWGTCMPQKRKIILNATLSRFSPVCLEFVIVHELGHIFNPNHGPQFYAWLDRWLPDWRDRAARLSGGS